MPHTKNHKVSTRPSAAEMDALVQRLRDRNPNLPTQAELRSEIFRADRTQAENVRAWLAYLRTL